MTSKSLTRAPRDLAAARAGLPGTWPADQLSGAQIRLIAIFIALAFWVGITMLVVDLLRG